MHIIAVDEIIYFNSTVDDYFLSTIVLLSFAYHPSYSHILYLLYGCTLSPSPGKTYSSLFILIRNSKTDTFVQNITITQSFECLINCEMKATQSLLLIESESLIGIYSINGSNFQIAAHPFINSLKIGLTQNNNIHRWADIDDRKFLVILDTNNFMIGEYNRSGLGNTTSLVYSMSFINANSILFTGITQNNVYLAINSSSVTLIYYSCLPCAFNRSLVALTPGNTLVIHTGLYTEQAYRIYHGVPISNPSLLNGIIYWAFSGGWSWKFLINATSYKLIESYNNYSAVLTTANNDYYLLVGSDQSVNFRSFQQVLQETQFNYYSYFGYSTVPSTSIASVRLSWDSSMVGVRTLADSWRLQQFQLTTSCQDYNATESSANNLFCDCHSYGEDNLCTIMPVAQETSISSFPLTIVISVVAGAIAIGISMIIIKKNYRRCTKARQRTAYVYNPAELMSYEL